MKTISRWVVALCSVVVAACGGVDSGQLEKVGSVTQRLSASSVLTHHNNLQRTGVQDQETTLTPANVQPATFGQRAFRLVDGQVYAQILYAGGVVTSSGTKNVIYVATMKNNVYAFDADNLTTDPGAASRIWTRLAPVSPIQKATNSATGDTFLSGTATIGIMGTPVIDAAANTMYLVAGEQATINSWKWWLYALDIRSGAIIGRVAVAGTFGGSTFTGINQIQRSALTLVGGRVAFGFAGVADAPPYRGWIFSYPTNPSTWAATPPVPLVYATASSGVSGGGVWQSGGGFASDGTNLFAMTGNSKTVGACSNCNAFIKLSNSTLSQLAAWQPADFVALDSTDQDLGSGGPVLLPGTTNGLAGAGKTGVLFSHDLSLAAANVKWFQAAERQMAPFYPLACQTTAVPASSLPITYDNTNSSGMEAPNVHGSPVAWSNASFRRLYIWAEKDFLKGYNYDANGNFAQPACAAATPTVQGPVKANPGMPGGMLSLSSNGSSNGILWATIPEPDFSRCNQPSQRIANSWCNANAEVVKGRIYAFDATTLALIWDAYLPSFAKFAPPTIAGGKVFVPTFSDRILIFAPHASFTPTWTSLDGAVAPGARPAITSWDPATRMDVFVRGADNSLLHKAWNSGTWAPAGSWEGLGGFLTSNPTATTFSTPEVDIFVRNGANDVSQRLWNGTWSSWFTVPGGGTLWSDPVAVSWGNGRVDLFALGGDSQLKHLSYTGTWQPWEGTPFNGVVLKAGSRPAVVSRAGSNRIDIVARGDDDRLKYISCTGACAGTSWSAWTDLGGILNSDPAMDSWGTGRLDAFVQGTDLQLKHIAFAGGAWTGWESSPFEGLTLKYGSTPVALSWASGKIDVYARSYGVADDGAHNLLTHIAWNGTTWTWWEPMEGGIIVADPVAMHAGNKDQVVVIGLGNSTWATSRPSGVLP
jgi:hypothetical protein